VERVPYEGEFASYQPLRRIAESDAVQQLLRRSRLAPSSGSEAPALTFTPAPDTDLPRPEFVVAIDGSNAEVDVRNGYPGAKVGYCTVASVLLDLQTLDALDSSRPVDPVAFRRTEDAATIDAALPGSNVTTREHGSSLSSFREALFDVLHSVVVDTEDRTPLLDTYEALLALKPQEARDGQRCPYADLGCELRVVVGPGVGRCGCERNRVIYSTDAMRIHEGFRDAGSNLEALGEVMQVWERLLVIHLLRCFERRGWLGRLGHLIFVLDGPLAVFGHPAWLSAAIKSEMQRLNARAAADESAPIMLVGVEKSGAFVAHFDELDQSESGEPAIAPASFALLTDAYIKRRIIYSESEKRYGLDTYFGRKLFYKTTSGARLVLTIPFLTPEQDELDRTEADAYPQLAPTLKVIDSLVSSRYRNAVAPVVSAHAQAAIPLHLGAKVLEQLARALMGTDPE
jgi:hypothetical protein